MIKLDTDDVLSLHNKMYKATGGIPGIRDIQLGIGIAEGKASSKYIKKWISRHKSDAYF